jgi:hypothetical protein
MNKSLTRSSASFLRDARRAKKGSGTSPKLNVRYVEFTPEEMAMDCPTDVSDTKRYPTVTRGGKDWKKFINFRNGFARLAPDVRKAFPTNRSVNVALRRYLQAEKSK